MGLNKILMKLFNNKKGLTVADLQQVGIMLVVISVTLGLGAAVLTAIQATQTANSYASNITGFGLSGLNTLATWLPTIALVVVIAVIIGVIMMYLARRYG